MARSFFPFATVAAAALIVSPALSLAQGSQAVAAVQKTLHGKEYRNVQVSEQNGSIVLSGSVEILGVKMDAEKRAQKAAGNEPVVDNIAVSSAGEISDAALTAKLANKLTYDRVGYGTTTFNAITVGVQNGVVTLGGMVVEPTDKSSALGLVESEKGVRGLIDHLKVAPLSPMDNRVRLDEARAIYGSPQLQKYAINPAKPIRIAVENGHVTLVGVVDNQGDKDVAGIRANGVPGVFSVTNDLQVAGSNER